VFFPAGHKEKQLQFFFILIAVRKPILDLFWLARVKGEWRILERDEVK